MSIIDTVKLNFNRKVRVDFNGGNLTSDGGLLLFGEFLDKLNVPKLVRKLFHTKDTAKSRTHTDADNLMQVVYQTISAYFTDDCSDYLKNDPLFTSLLQTESLASQPTLSRFYNRMDEETLTQFDSITRDLRKTVYALDPRENIVLDLDSTLIETYGKQEGTEFNYHYSDVGYHPLVCFDALTGDLLKIELRKGAQYCSNGAADFLKPLLQELDADFPEKKIALRADSGFAAPEIYDLAEDNECQYAIRLKENRVLVRNVKEWDNDLFDATRDDVSKYGVVYGEFLYQAESWRHPRRVVFKIEKPSGKFDHVYTFIVTTLTADPETVLQFYAYRGCCENYIKEAKLGFDFSSLSSATMPVNANRLQLRALAYNLFNWFRRLVLPQSMKKDRIGTVRLKLFKIAAKMVKSAGHIRFSLCSSCPYEKEFGQTLENIWRLAPGPELFPVL